MSFVSNPEPATRERDRGVCSNQLFAGPAMLPVHRRVGQAGSTAKIVSRPGYKFSSQNTLPNMNIIIFTATAY